MHLKGYPARVARGPVSKTVVRLDGFFERKPKWMRPLRTE
jgi:hypothetical protein